MPKDIVICEWHCDSAPETALFFAKMGFDVVVSPWRKPEVALAELAQIRNIRSSANPAVARRALEIM